MALRGKTRHRRGIALAATAALALLAAVGAGFSATATANAVVTTPRIVGGGPVPASVAPWQAAIYDASNVINPHPFCGGSLIRPRIVLTAAHCVRDPPSPFNTHPDSIRVALGRTTFKSTEGFDTKVIAAVSDPTYIPSVPSTVPGEYVSDPRGGDAAILVLESPVPPGAAKRIMLAGPGEMPLWRPGKIATVSGFGYETETATQTSPVLKETRFPIIRDAYCKNKYGPNVYLPTQFCAGALAGGTDACFGDSGGALTVKARGGRGGLVRQAGIVSSGDGCAKPNIPGLYSRVGVPPLRTFIQSAVNASPDPGRVIGRYGVCGRGPAKSVRRCLCKQKKNRAKRLECLQAVDGATKL